MQQQVALAAKSLYTCRKVKRKTKSDQQGNLWGTACNGGTSLVNEQPVAGVVGHFRFEVLVRLLVALRFWCASRQNKKITCDPHFHYHYPFHQSLCTIHFHIFIQPTRLPNLQHTPCIQEEILQIYNIIQKNKKALSWLMVWLSKAAVQNSAHEQLAMEKRPHRKAQSTSRGQCNVVILS